MIEIKLKKPSKLDMIGSMIQYLMCNNPKIENSDIIPVIMETMRMNREQATRNYFIAVERLLKECIINSVSK